MRVEPATLAVMEEASGVSVVVDPFVPPARLGALLIAHRSQGGLGIAEMAARSHGMFSSTFLANAERGLVLLDDQLIGQLVGLYQVDSGPVVPQRSELVLDIDHQRLVVGDQAVPITSLHVDEVLKRYVSLIYTLRGLQPGSEFVLRDADLDVLARSLGATRSAIRHEITALVSAPESVQRARRVRTRTMVLAAGALVGVTALGSLVLVRAQGPNSGPVAANQTRALLSVTGLAAEVGQRAEATVDFDFRAALPSWEIGYGTHHPDFLGVTYSAEKTITVHVAPGASVESVAGVLMHEVGHALDLERLDDSQRAEWITLRNMPAAWWPGDGLSDFAVGAGDFAEAVAAYTTGSPSRSVYGEFTPEQLAFVARIVNGG